MEDIGALLTKATGITCDSRRVEPGYIFVAIRGRSQDGNAFASAAAARQAAAVVSDRPQSLPPLGIPVVTVPDARRALAELAARFYRHPSRHLALTGVTGTNGKTTVAFMLDHIFRQAGFVTGLIGTVCVKTGAFSFPSTLTTPDSASLQAYLAAMRDNAVTHAAIEVSAQGIDLNRVDAVRFSCGILTNVSPDHLDFHRDFAAYVVAKQGFPALLGPDAPLVANTANPHCRSIAANARGPVVTAAIDEPADVTARILQSTSMGSLCSLYVNRPLTGIGGYSLPPGMIAFPLPLPGRHNVENALLAVTAALLHGVAPAVATEAMATFQGVPRRLSVYRCNGFAVIDDTALNPGSIEAIFNTIKSFRFRRLVVAFAIRGNRGAAINAANALALGRWWHTTPFTLIVTAGSDCVGPADAVTDEEKSAFCEALGETDVAYLYCETLTAAMAAALTTASGGDLLVLLGAQGMDEGYRLLRRLARDEAGEAVAGPETASLSV